MLSAPFMVSTGLHNLRLECFSRISFIWPLHALMSKTNKTVSTLIVHKSLSPFEISLGNSIIFETEF